MAEFEVCVCGECVIECPFCLGTGHATVYLKEGELLLNVCPLCGGDKTIEVQVEDMDTTAEIDPPDTDWRD